MSNLAIKLETVQFHNQSLIVLNHQNKPYVAMKPICENIGLDWTAQPQRIKRHKVLNSGMVMITTPSNKGKQKYVCLPISIINGWLFGIDTNRVKSEIKPVLEQYQLECFDVLFNHFMPKVAEQLTDTITDSQEQALIRAINRCVERIKQHCDDISTCLCRKFNISKRSELPQSKLDEAYSILNSMTRSDVINNRYPVEVKITDFMFNGEKTITGKCNDFNALLTNLALKLGYKIERLSSSPQTLSF